MGREGVVASVTRKVEDGANLVEVTLDANDLNPSTSVHYAAPGDDAPPLAGDHAALVEAPGSGNENAVGYFSPSLEGKAAPGEKRIFGRSPSGEVVSELWLKGDGSVVIENLLGGKIEMAADGSVTINGVTIDLLGNISTLGTVDALDVSVIASTPPGVSLGTHVHNVPSPVSAPTEGPIGL